MKQLYVIVIILSLLCGGISCGIGEPGTNHNPDTTPPSITDVSTSNITETSAVITWTTDETGTGQVEYGLTTSYGITSTLVTNLVASHSVTLSGLSAATPYHYRVKSNDASQNEAVSGDYTFTTATPPDTTPPVVSAVATSGITSSGVTITWFTDEAATGQVEYGQTTAYGSTTTLDTALATSHSVSLSGLNATTTYHYRVKSKDASDNEAASEDYTFITTAPPDTIPPGISAVAASSIATSAATITWTTDEAATSQVEYGLTTSYGSTTTLDTNMVSSHSVSLSGLSAGTSYHFRVKSADADGNKAMSKDQTFETKPNLDLSFGGTTEEYEYSPYGVCVSATIGVSLENKGSAGDVFVAVAYAGSDSVNACNVFHFDKGESATVYSIFSFPPPSSEIKWTARAAASGDCHQGDIWLERGNGTIDHGLPEHFSLLGVWGNSSSDVFAVGDDGTILHYNGTAWSAMSSGTTYSLNDVWGSSSSDVFAVGCLDTILHYNGSAWSAMSSGSTYALSGVWGGSSSDVFAVGDSGTILHYNGSAWSAISSGTTYSLNDVWGSSATDVFAVGEGGTILHYNGSAWSAMSSGTTKWLYGVWGRSASDVFAVGGSGTILHYNGSAWSAMSSGTTNWLYGGVWGSSATDVFAVGEGGTILHYNGSTWSAMTSGSTYSLNGVWGSSSSDVFAVGGAGTILHYDGYSWDDVSL